MVWTKGNSSCAALACGTLVEKVYVTVVGCPRGWLTQPPPVKVFKVVGWPLASMHTTIGAGMMSIDVDRVFMLSFDEANGLRQQLLVDGFNVTVAVDDVNTLWEVLDQFVVALVDLGQQLLAFKLEAVKIAS